MKTFVELVESTIDDTKVYKEKDNLWVAYAAGSGSSVPLRGKSYITDKSGDANYDESLVKQLVKFSGKNKPIKAKGTSKMFALPMYDDYKASNYDIWGGETKPRKIGAFIVDTGKINVVTFFDTKKEANMWLKQKA